MALPIGWDTQEPLAGENDPFGREDTANKYVRTVWINYQSQHNDDGSHKQVGLAKIADGSYTSSVGDKVINLTDSTLQIDTLIILSDLSQFPVLVSADMTSNDSKEFGTAAFQSNLIKDISTAGQFTAGQDDAVNAQGSTENYYYIAIGRLT